MDIVVWSKSTIWNRFTIWEYDQSLLLIAKNFFVAHERTFVDTPVFWKDGETESTNVKEKIQSIKVLILVKPAFW